MKQFQDTAVGVELLLAALDYIELAQQRMGNNKVLETAAWCLRYYLSLLNENDQPRI